MAWRGLAWPDTFLKPQPSTVLTPGPPHPWLAAPDDAFPGKIAHVAALVRIQGTLDSFSREGRGPQIHPLLSQPIMELCLHIQSWQWVSKGRNRSVAREAFDPYLPDTIKHRRSKGGPTHFACAVVEANLPALRDQLLGGHLDRHGILNTAGIAHLLSGKTKIEAADHIRISILAEAEAWARYWAARRVARSTNTVGPVQCTPDGAPL